MTVPRPSSLARALLALGAVLPAALAGCDSQVEQPGDDPPATCTQGGVTYDEGDSFPAPDGCNTCTCTESGNIACTLMGCVGGCEHQGQIHAPGESFPAGDGCNTCSCMDDGTVACTLIACEPGCEHQGQMYPPGASFPAGDGCNTCTCQPDGTVACTDIACPCDPPAEWWREYLSLDAQECLLLDFSCPLNTLRFDNGCGCGCEQDASCPQFFDCMPPSTCDVQMIMEQCPYSEIVF